MISCYIRYRIDMYQFAQFEQYARMWIPLVDPDCQAGYAFAEKTRCIISYERQFLRPVQPS